MGPASTISVVISKFASKNSHREACCFDEFDAYVTACSAQVPKFSMLRAGMRWNSVFTAARMVGSGTYVQV
jgi:hypothetical protein